MRRIALIFALIVGVLALSPGLALSQHEHATPAKADAPKPAEGGHAAEDNSPFLPIQIDLGVWTLVVFLLLFFILSKYAWGPILVGLNKREHNIESAFAEAKQMREEMVRDKADFERKLQEMQQQIPVLLEKAHRDGEALKTELKAQAVAEINADRQRLRKEIETARDQALSEIWTQSANLATLISTKAIRKSLDGEDHRRLVDESLAELKVAGAKVVQENASLNR